MAYHKGHREDLVIKPMLERAQSELVSTLEEAYRDAHAYDKNNFGESSFNDLKRNYTGMTETERKAWAAKCRVMYEKDVHFKNIINTMVALIMGSGIRIFIENSNSQKLWDSFWRRNGFGRKQFQILRTILVEGECFVRFFKKSFTRKGMKARLVPPSKVKGINTDINDFESPVSYDIVINQMGEIDTVPADEVVHLKMDPYGTRLRGTPLISKGAMVKMERYDLLEHSRLLLNVIRASLPLVHEIDGTPEQIENAAAKHKKMPQPGSKVTISAREKLYYPDLNINASDTVEDADRLTKGMASDVSMTKDFISGETDLRHGQFLLTAGSPVVKVLEMFQTLFITDWHEIVDQVVGEGADRRLRVPRIPQRNLQSDAQGLREFHKTGGISITDISEYMDKDWEREVLPLIAEEMKALEKIGLTPSGAGLVLALSEDDPRVKEMNANKNIQRASNQPTKGE